MSDDNEYLWRQPGTRTTAERLLEAEIADAKSGGAYDFAAEQRHQRRLRAMRALGEAETWGWRLYFIAIASIVVLVAAVAIMVIAK